MTLIDNTVLSNFAIVDRLPLLRVYCRGRGLTTRTVLEEFQAGIRHNLFPNPDLSWLRSTDVKGREENLLFQTFLTRLDRGEASCLSITLHRRHILLTDDLDTRKLARRRGVSISGSVGVLIDMVRKAKLALPEANSVLHDLVQAGYFSPVESLDTLI